MELQHCDKMTFPKESRKKGENSPASSLIEFINQELKINDVNNPYKRIIEQALPYKDAPKFDYRDLNYEGGWGSF